LNVGNATKLIIFLHFHKAGGTSIVRAAKKRQNLFSPNGNGNPKFKSGFFGKIPFYDYSKEGLISFFGECLNENNATFIATENRYFRSAPAIDTAFKRQNRIELVTQIRNPFDRFVSNFFFDLRLGAYRESESVRDLSFVQRLKRYHSCGDGPGFAALCSLQFNGTNDWNMYIRVLTDQFNRSQKVTAEALDVAKSEMDKFDLVTVLEMESASDLWAAKYGLEVQRVNAQTKYDEIYAAERKKHYGFDREFKKFQEEYERLNRFDYLLYEYAQGLHRAFAVKYRVSSDRQRRSKRMR